MREQKWFWRLAFWKLPFLAYPLGRTHTMRRSRMSGHKLFAILMFTVMLMALLSACVAVQPVASEPAATGQEMEEHDHESGTPGELGSVEFPVSCTAEAQTEFNHGMALLHSFWFGPAINSFNTVAELDPTCAMAHWGIAMARLGNPFTWPLSGQALVDGWAAVEMATLNPRIYQWQPARWDNISQIDVDSMPAQAARFRDRRRPQLPACRPGAQPCGTW